MLRAIGPVLNVCAICGSAVAITVPSRFSLLQIGH
jgi:rRNA maturation protein Nop10